MADAIRISNLPTVIIGDLGPEDQLVINDAKTGADEITSKLSLGSLIDFITDQELVFTKPIQISELVPSPDGFDVTVDSIHINYGLSVGPFCKVEGIELDDLDDVEIDEQLLDHGQTLVWDSVKSAWVNDYIDGSNITDTVELNFDLLRDSIDTLNDSINLLSGEIDDLQTELDQVKNELSDKIDQAPNDGQLYVRQGTNWVALPETFSIDRDL